MNLVRVHSEWDLGIAELYGSVELARNAVRDALPEVGLDDSLEEYEEDNLIGYETVFVVMKVD